MRPLRGMRTTSQDTWQRFADHVMECGPCRQAGGVSAPADALCPIGKGLVEAYEASEELDPISGSDKGG